jgi:peptidylprolyl isomerase
MRTRTLTACGLAALALTAAGCGGDDTETAEFNVDAPAAETGATKTQAAQTEAAEPEAAAGEAKAGKPKVQIPSGPPPKQLETRDIKEGTGATAKAGDEVTMNYVGVSYSTKKQFDASFDRGEPFTFTLGQGAVIAGWDEGIVGMKVGGRRELIIPPDKGYGAAGQGPDIKPNETLVFVVDLVDVK